MAVTVAAVETAIDALQAGAQSFTVDGVTYTRASLGALLELRKRLQDESLRSAGTRPVIRGIQFTTWGIDASTNPRRTAYHVRLQRRGR